MGLRGGLEFFLELSTMGTICWACLWYIYCHVT